MRQIALVSLLYLLYYNHLHLNFTGLRGTEAVLINAFAALPIDYCKYPCVSPNVFRESWALQRTPLLLLRELINAHIINDASALISQA